MLGGEKAAVAFHGDHRPASIYVDGQVISEPAESTKEGTMLTFDRTYNDRAQVSVFGESVQETLTGKNLWSFGQSYSSVEGKYSNWISDKTPFSLDAGTYTVSATEANLPDSAPLFGYLQDGMRIELIRFVKNEVLTKLSNTFRITQPITSVYFVANEGGSVENIMIEAGSEATSYEPYCGGIPAPNPSYPMPIESRAAACVETSNADGSKTSTIDITALLDGRELRSLPDGTRDELQVRDNGDGTGDVVLVERCDASMFDDTKSWSELGGSWKLATPTETVLGTIPMPDTFYDTTHIWEANGADISARVRVFADQTT